VNLQSLYDVAARYQEPLVYLILVVLGLLSRVVYRIDRTVAVLDTKVNMLLSGHKVVNNATGPSTKLGRFQ
jgi:hypothetical protein